MYTLMELLLQPWQYIAVELSGKSHIKIDPIYTELYSYHLLSLIPFLSMILIVVLIISGHTSISFYFSLLPFSYSINTAATIIRYDMWHACSFMNW